MYVYVCLCVGMCRYVQPRVVGSLELKLQVFLNLLTGVLGIELESSEGAAHALNH